MRREDTINYIAEAAMHRKQARAAKFGGCHKQAHQHLRQARVCMARASFVELEGDCRLYRFPPIERGQ